jgi:3-oxoacyl-[acyl-carrier-protein] synthase II
MESYEPAKIAYIAVHAAREAFAEANLNNVYNPNRCGVSIGTSHGGNHSLIKFLKQKFNLSNQDIIDYSLLLSTTPSIAGYISKELNLTGLNTSISTACSSSTTSIGIAADYIKSGLLDMAIAGGADLFSELTMSGFNSLKALCIDVCRPLSSTRTGLLLGEGSAFFILEKASKALERGAKIYAEILGFYFGNEAFHETAPDPSGESAYMVMKKAIEKSGITTDDIDYINMHGTATTANDPIELTAVKKLFQHRIKEIYVSSTKSMIGHALGAAGSLELAATVLAMENNFIPPTINFEESIPGFEDINVVPNVSLEKEITTALSNSFAFAGHMASIVVRKWKE